LETKICSKCKEEQNVCKFGKDSRKKDGLRVTCNDCRKLESKLYREKYPEKRKQTYSLYYQNNKEKVLIKFKEYKEKNPEKRKEISLKSYHKNKEKYKERQKEYRESVKTIRAKYQKMLLETNVVYKISQLCRSRIHNFLTKNNITKRNKTFDIVGCTPEFLKEHIEKQFTEKMSWGLMGKYIHIDHIIPLSSAKTEEEVYQLCHYTNLQPLWAEDNLRKGNKII
jgi:hypothetical protein